MSEEKNNSIRSWLNTILLVLLGIIGFLYVEGQTTLKEKVQEAQEKAEKNNENLIRLESDFENYYKYSRQATDELKADLQKIEAKIDRLLQK